MIQPYPWDGYSGLWHSAKYWFLSAYQRVRWNVSYHVWRSEEASHFRMIRFWSHSERLTWVTNCACAWLLCSCRAWLAPTPRCCCWWSSEAASATARRTWRPCWTSCATCSQVSWCCPRLTVQCRRQAKMADQFCESLVIWDVCSLIKGCCFINVTPFKCSTPSPSSSCEKLRQYSDSRQTGWWHTPFGGHIHSFTDGLPQSFRDLRIATGSRSTVAELIVPIAGSEARLSAWRARAALWRRKATWLHLRVIADRDHRKSLVLNID